MVEWLTIVRTRVHYVAPEVLQSRPVRVSEIGIGAIVTSRQILNTLTLVVRWILIITFHLAPALRRLRSLVDNGHSS